MRTLIATWLVTMGVVAALAVWLEMSYEPEGFPREPKMPVAEESAEPADDAVLTEPDAMPLVNAEEGTTESPAGDSMTSPSEASTLVPDTAPSSSPTAAISSDQLFEQSAYGAIPLSVSGTQPWRAFGTPSDVSPRTPRIAIILSGLGLNSRITQKAILETPSEVTLAFSPYGQNLGQFAEDAARLSHEMLIMIPMEPNDYPVNDPGPHSLLTSLSAEQNIDRLHFLLARFQGYVGLINDMGSRFTSSGNALRPIMADLQRRGLLFVDARSSSASVAIAVAQDFGVPWAENTRFIDHRASGREIDKALADLERMAKINGVAVGVGHPYPITVERIISWAPTLADKGIALVPITATAMKRTVR